MPEPETCEECGGEAIEGCNGRGWIVRMGGDNGAAAKCPQVERRRRLALIEAARVPERYREATLDNFDTSGPGEAVLRAALAAARSYLERFRPRPAPAAGNKGFRRVALGDLHGGAERTPSGLLFFGPPGTGKTHLVIAILRELVMRYGVRGYFIDFNALAHEIQATFDDPERSKEAVLRPVMTADLLVLDELGALRPSPWVLDTLYLIINGRYSQSLPTLFTSNYPLELTARAAGGKGLDRAMPQGDGEAGPAEDLRVRMNPRLVSRLFELGPAVTLEGAEDYRRKIARARKPA